MNVYDEYVVVYCYEDNRYYRVKYTKTEETVELGDKEECFIIDVNADEYAALKTFHENHNSYSVINDYEAQAAQVTALTESNETLTQSNNELTAANENLAAENQKFSTKIVESEELVATLKQRRALSKRNFLRLPLSMMRLRLIKKPQMQNALLCALTRRMLKILLRKNSFPLTLLYFLMKFWINTSMHWIITV